MHKEELGPKQYAQLVYNSLSSAIVIVLAAKQSLVFTFSGTKVSYCHQIEWKVASYQRNRNEWKTRPTRGQKL